MYVRTYVSLCHDFNFYRELISVRRKCTWVALYSTDVEDRGPDYIEAHKWFNLAAMLGSMPAKAYRDELVMEMTPEDVTAAQRSARDWLKTNRELLEQRQKEAA